MKSICKIIIHVLELAQKNFECLTSKPKAHGTFESYILKLIKNLISWKLMIELKFCMLSIFKLLEYAVLK